MADNPQPGGTTPTLVTSQTPPQNPLILGNKVMSTKAIKFVSYETIFYAETMLFHKDEFTDVVDNIFFKKLLSEYIPETTDKTKTPPVKTSAKYSLKYKDPIPETKPKIYKEVNSSDNDDIFTEEISISLGAGSPGIMQLTSIKDNTLINNIEELNIPQRFILISLYKELFKSSIINLWKNETDALFILPCFLYLFLKVTSVVSYFPIITGVVR